RGAWLKKLREICDDNDVLLIFDEVQCGMGATGKTWCCQHFDVLPDLLAFGKKAQTCGVMAGPRLDEVKDNAFRLPSRLNSTWGGNLVDMVRSTHYMHIIEEQDLANRWTKDRDDCHRFGRGLQKNDRARPGSLREVEKNSGTGPRRHGSSFGKRSSRAETRARPTRHSRDRQDHRGRRRRSSGD